jgi:hypothetical protein
MATTYETNVKEQYEALGRFIEAFEGMVHEARETCIDILSRDGKHILLVQVTLHHQNLAAKAVFEICRGLIAEVLNDAVENTKLQAEGKVRDLDPPLMTTSKGEPLQITPAVRDKYFGLMRFIAAEYDDLVNKRNNLLHATWFVGYSGSEDPDCKEFFVRKLTSTKEGFKLVELPKNATELGELTSRCQAVKDWIAWLHACLEGQLDFDIIFIQDGKQWWLNFGEKTTLPNTQIGPYVLRMIGQAPPNPT